MAGVEADIGMQGNLGGKLIKGPNHHQSEVGKVVELDLSKRSLLRQAKSAIKHIVLMRK